MVHVNPLTSNDGASMSWRDAAVVALVSTCAVYFIQFLVGMTYRQIIADPGAFVFDSVKILGATFFGTLGSLKGLAQIYAKKE